MNIAEEINRVLQLFALVSFGLIGLFSQPVSAAERKNAIENFLERARSEDGNHNIPGGPVSPIVTHKGTEVGCPINFTSDLLSLNGSERYARAEFVMGSDCRLTPIVVVRSAEIPDVVSARAGSFSKFPARSAGSEAQFAADGDRNATSQAVSHTCQVDVWEEDVVGVRMITARDSISWETEGGKIPHGDAHWVIFPNLDWWFADGKPDGGARYVTEPYTATTWVTGNFYCNGAGPISGIVCKGPSYRIQLHGSLLIDGGGNCSGQAQYGGVIVPQGKVLFEVTRQ